MELLFARDSHGDRLNLKPSGSITLRPLRVRQEDIDFVMEREDQGKQSSLHPRLKPVTSYIIETTRDNRCRCEEEHGLRAGITVDALTHIGAGCTAGSRYRPGYVCPRLDRVRRLMGH